MRKRTFIMSILLFSLFTGCSLNSPLSTSPSPEPTTSSLELSGSISKTTTLFSDLIPNNWSEIHYILFPSSAIQRASLSNTELNLSAEQGTQSVSDRTVTISNPEHLNAIYQLFASVPLQEIEGGYAGFAIDLQGITSENTTFSIAIVNDRIISIGSATYQTVSDPLPDLSGLLQRLGYPVN